MNDTVLEMYDVVVVGGGIVGLATARAMLDAHPGLSLVVLEKELQLASHQTGHNSGVIHSGIYYAPGSNKARMVTTGRAALFDLCDSHDIPYEVCGKVIVATDAAQLPKLQVLEGRAEANKIKTLRLSRSELQELEPNADGLEALHVPGCGIVDFVQVSENLAKDIVESGGEIKSSTAVTGIHETRDSVTVETTSGVFECRVLVNCAGLFADRIAKMTDPTITDVRIMGFRGEYYELISSSRHLVRNLIYPVPDDRFPFLGVHFTRMMNGEVHAGPNAVLALAREGYSWRDVSMQDSIEVLKSRGSWTLAKRYWNTGLGEIHRSLSKKAFVRALQKLIPAIQRHDVIPDGSGVRAQAIDPSGQLLDDFAFADSPRSVHVINAPSPAATASLAIGDVVSKRALSRL